MVDETLIASCHRAVIRASRTHLSPEGFELLIHPALRSTVAAYEVERRLRPGSFAALASAKRLTFTLAAGDSFAVFCLTHMHRLDDTCGVVDESGGSDAGTIGG